MNKYNLVVTQEDLAVLDRALSALPYGQVVSLFESIKNQLKEQVAKSKEKEESTD